MHAISRRLALLVLGALAMLGTGCGDDEGSGPGAGIAGSYTLRSVNGQDVPMTAYEGNASGFPVKVEVLSGFVTLELDGRFLHGTSVRQVIAGGAPMETNYPASGKFTRSGNTLTLADEGGTATYTFVVQDDGSLLWTGDVSGFPISARYVRQ